MGLTVKQIIEIGQKQLSESGVRDAKRDSETLYCYLVGVPESKLFTEYQYTLQDLLCDKYFALIDRRSAGEPLQYIVGNTAFMGLPFKVAPGVLIPRQDTETLVEDALTIINDGHIRREIYGLEKKSWDVLDMCTGSGAIGVSIAKLGEKVNVTMSDVSSDTLSMAKENAKLNGVDKSCKFVEGSFFEPFAKRFGSKKFDMIISNPPYIPTEVIGTLQREIKEYEPRIALDGGLDGLNAYRAIAAGVAKHLKPGGILLLEIGHDQSEQVADILHTADIFDDIRCYPDLAGRDRVIFGKA